MTDYERLREAAKQLLAAADEFVEAHAKVSGGHSPTLWSTHYDNRAIIVTWASHAQRVAECYESEPHYEIPFPLTRRDIEEFYEAQG